MTTWLVDVLTVGEAISESDPTATDGYVSSLVTLVFLVGVGVSLSLSTWAAAGNHTTCPVRSTDIINHSETATHILLTAYMLVALATITSLWLSDVTRSKFIKPRRPRTKMPLGAYIKYLIVNWPSLFGLGVFFVLVVVLHAAVFATYVPCWSHGRQWSVTCVVVTLYDVVHLIFGLVLLAFCCRFHDCAVERDPRVRYALATVLAATITVWFDGVISTPFYNDPDRNDCFRQCLHYGTRRRQVLDSIGLFLSPLQTQFLTMSIKIVLKLFLDAVTVEDFRRIRQEYHSAETMNENSIMFGSSSTLQQLDSESIEEAGLLRSLREHHEAVPRQRNLESHGGTCCSCLRHAKVHVPVIILYHVTYAVFVGVHQKYIHLAWFNGVYAFIFLVAQVIFCAVCILGFRALRVLHAESRPYKGLEMYILLVSGAYVIIVVFKLVYDCSPSGNTVLDQLPFSIWSFLVFLVILFVQTLFMFRATRVTVPCTTRGPLIDQTTLERSCCVFYNVVFFLVIDNFVNWIFQAIVRYPLYGQHPIKLPNDRHDIISNVMHPLYLFYSFNITLAFLGVYLKRYTTARC